MLRATSINAGAAALLLTLTIGCGQAAMAPPVAAPEPGERPTPEATLRFQAALSRVARHDRANDWTEEACKDAVAELLAAGEPGSVVPRYDAALVEQRCGRHAQAKALLHDALDRDPRFYLARAALALYAAEEPRGLDHAIDELAQVVADTGYTSVEALVALATLQARRASKAVDGDGADDFDRARKNLSRALAVDDRYMPALDQLARLHLGQARRGGARAGKKASQALELAALVCAQATRKNPRYAPIHNTAGLVEMELGNPSRAAAHFDEARRLDPRLIEAHLNYAAVNLGFRGFAQAEEAYRAVLALRPDEYDARLGLALALRGQIDATGEPARVDAAARELAAARRIAPDRPEAYYNEAILVQEYGGRGLERDKVRAELGRAKGLYATFLEKAGGAEAFHDARERARERMSEIDEMQRFIP